MGLVVAWLLAGELGGRERVPPPPTTMLGGLYQHVTAPREPKYKYGPTNVNYGLLPPLDGTRKDNRKPRMAERARTDLTPWLQSRSSSSAFASVVLPETSVIA
jgi:methylenetetrahydrofolate--tRNA-(uracil-5-)-methyltransferase